MPRGSATCGCLRVGASISVVAEVVRLRSELSRVRLLPTVIDSPVLIGKSPTYWNYSSRRTRSRTGAKHTTHWQRWRKPDCSSRRRINSFSFACDRKLAHDIPFVRFVRFCSKSGTEANKGNEVRVRMSNRESASSYSTECSSVACTSIRSWLSSISNWLGCSVTTHRHDLCNFWSRSSTNVRGAISGRSVALEDGHSCPSSFGTFTRREIRSLSKSMGKSAHAPGLRWR